MKVDYINSFSQQSLYDGKEVYVGNAIPSSPIDGAIWSETNIASTFPQPWVWNSSQGEWLSQSVLLPIPKITLTTEASDFQYFPVRTYGADGLKMYIEYYFGLVFNLSSTAHSSTNYWGIDLKCHKSDGTQPVIWSSPSNTGFNFGSASGLPGSLPRHIQHDVNVGITGRMWSIGVNYVKVGTPPTAGIEISSAILMRYARP